jgi:transposase InsO family protein
MENPEVERPVVLAQDDRTEPAGAIWRSVRTPQFHISAGTSVPRMCTRRRPEEATRPGERTGNQAMKCVRLEWSDSCGSLVFRAPLAQTVETTRQNKRATAAPDLVDRHVSAVEPNRLWVADLTYIKTLQGILYLAVVVDMFSRKVVGWQMADDHRLGADCLRDGIVAPRGGPGPADPSKR